MLIVSSCGITSTEGQKAGKTNIENNHSLSFKEHLILTCQKYLRIASFEGDQKEAAFLELTIVDNTDSIMSLELRHKQNAVLTISELSFYPFFFTLDSSIANPILLKCTNSQMQQLQDNLSNVSIESNSIKKCYDLLNNSNHDLWEMIPRTQHSYYYFLIKYNMLEGRYSTRFMN